MFMAVTSVPCPECRASPGTICVDRMGRPNGKAHDRRYAMLRKAQKAVGPIPRLCGATMGDENRGRSIRERCLLDENHAPPHLGKFTRWLSGPNTKNPVLHRLLTHPTEKTG